MYELDCCTMKQVKEDLLFMCNKHSQELYNKPIDVNWDAYFAMESAGVIKVFTIRYDKTPIGYAIFTVTSSLHHSSRKMAICDSIFIEKPFRRSGAAVMLVEYAERELYFAGAKTVTISVPAETPHSNLFSSLGYSPSEVAYQKQLR